MLDKKREIEASEYRLKPTKWPNKIDEEKTKSPYIVETIRTGLIISLKENRGSKNNLFVVVVVTAMVAAIFCFEYKVIPTNYIIVSVL